VCNYCVCICREEEAFGGYHSEREKDTNKKQNNQTEKRILLRMTKAQ
jgi:hypothetical protein